MELTNLTYEELEQKLEEVQENLRIERQRGMDKNIQQIAEWEQQEADILAKMDEASKLQVEVAHEERVKQVSDDFIRFLQAVDLGNGITVRNLIPNDDEYNLLLKKLERGLSAVTSPLSEEIRGYQEREVVTNRQVQSLQRRNYELENETQRLNTLNSILEQEKADAIAKRDAAASEADQLRLELDQTKNKLDQALKPSEVNTISEEEEALLELKAKAKRLVHSVTPDDPIFPKYYNGFFAIDDKPVQYPAMAKNYYIVVSREEAGRFREDYEAAAAKIKPVEEAAQPAESTDTIPSIPGVEPVGEQFPAQANPVGSDGVPASGAVSEGAGTDVEARIAALEARVSKLEYFVIPEQAGEAVA